MIDDPYEQMQYFTTHYWDEFLGASYTGVCDTAHVKGLDMETVEKEFGMYATLMWKLKIPDAQAALSVLFDQVEACEIADTSSNVFEKFNFFADKYFYDPNSPVRNEDMYLPYLQKLSKSQFLTETERDTDAHNAAMCALNQTGTKAANIHYKDINGKAHTLYDIDAEYTLLFFVNPGCPACKEIIEQLRSDDYLSDLVETGRLVVLDMYIDLELDKWKEYESNYPDKWLNGYDYTYKIRTDVTYNVRAIPSLYLLDRNKTVIFKDAPQDKVFEFLYQI